MHRFRHTYYFLTLFLLFHTCYSRMGSTVTWPNSLPGGSIKYIWFRFWWQQRLGHSNKRAAHPPTRLTPAINCSTQHMNYAMQMNIIITDQFLGCPRLPFTCTTLATKYVPTTRHLRISLSIFLYIEVMWRKKNRSCIKAVKTARHKHNASPALG